MTSQHCPDCQQPGAELTIGTGWHECRNPECDRKSYRTRTPTT
jgi:hypothetical protein